VSLVSGVATHACADRALRLQDDLGIDSLALAELVEVISTAAGIVVTDEETGRVLTVGDLQDILDARAPGTRCHHEKEDHMAKRVITPSGLGFLLLDAHPAGCERTVLDLANSVPRLADGRQGRRPVALVIGSSAGYGLAMTVAGLLRHGITGLGICFEKAPGRRTGTAGWYRTAATAGISSLYGDELTFLNADAFADATKDQAAAILADKYGPLDYLIYSVAAPRRTDPVTGTAYTSVLKPLGQAAATRTLSFTADGEPSLGETTIDPASNEEKDATVAVMGGADWERWITALNGKGLLAPGFRTVALTYIGSELTAPVYRRGTIGAAKIDLEATAGRITATLDATGGRAWTCVNGAAVTQASTHIPGIALYVSLLRAVLGDNLQSPAEQAVKLWDQLTGTAALDTDDAGRIRLDHWELDPAVQAQVARRWHAATQDTIGELADIGWFRTQFRTLYGFDVPGIDYTAGVETDIPWPGEEKPDDQR
jgi:enoyl-[acyl-carrier protein] reductase/trans-2-enoyl-CoA reductase (NAD+)